MYIMINFPIKPLIIYLMNFEELFVYNTFKQIYEVQKKPLYDLSVFDIPYTTDGNKVSGHGNLLKFVYTPVDKRYLHVTGHISASKGLHAGPLKHDIGRQSINYGTGEDITGSITPSLGKGYGDIVSIGNTTTVAGQVYCLDSDQSWVATDADGGCVSSSLLGVSLGTNSGTDGMLLRGFCQVSQSGTTSVGQKVYASTTPGTISGSSPAGSGDVVRILGYVLNSGVNNASASIYFNPDNTWVEIS